MDGVATGPPHPTAGLEVDEGVVAVEILVQPDDREGVLDVFGIRDGMKTSTERDMAVLDSTAVRRPASARFSSGPSSRRPRRVPVGHDVQESQNQICHHPRSEQDQDDPAEHLGSGSEHMCNVMQPFVTITHQVPPPIFAMIVSQVTYGDLAVHCPYESYACTASLPTPGASFHYRPPVDCYASALSRIDGQCFRLVMAGEP